MLEGSESGVSPHLHADCNAGPRVGERTALSSTPIGRECRSFASPPGSLARPGGRACRTHSACFRRRAGAHRPGSPTRCRPPRTSGPARTARRWLPQGPCPTLHTVDTPCTWPAMCKAHPGRARCGPSHPTSRAHLARTAAYGEQDACATHTLPRPPGAPGGGAPVEGRKATFRPSQGRKVAFLPSRAGTHTSGCTGLHPRAATTAPPAPSAPRRSRPPSPSPLPPAGPPPRVGAPPTLRPAAVR